MLAFSGAKVQSPFYPGELVTGPGDREIHSVSRRLPDYPGELASLAAVYSFLSKHEFKVKL